MGSPLFTHSSAMFRRARGEFERSAAGVVMREGEAAMRGKSFSPGKLAKALSQVKRLRGRPEKLIQEAVGAELGEIVGHLSRYRRSVQQNDAIKEFLAALGPAGKAIQAILEPVAKGQVGTTRSISAAINLVRSVGSEVLPSLKVRSGPEFDRAMEAVQQWVEAQGYRLERTGVQGVEAPRQGEPPSFAQPTGRRKTVDVTRSDGGKLQRYRPDHPMISGEFVQAPASTNVHSFGYDLQAAILYVRYQSDTGGPGSMYRYSPVEPELFDELYKTRRGGDGHGGSSTPGTWIWSNLRIRGTISGHQKDYALVGVMQQYVPRKATVHPDMGEILVERQVRTTEGKWLKSRSGTEGVGNVIRGGNVNRGAARTGRPGAPNRGRARTGRP